MSSLNGKVVALGVGAGVAAYKACEVVRGLQKAGVAEVRVCMTPRATHFISPLLFQALSRKPVLTDLLDVHQEGAYGHLDVARGADLFLVVPATADLVARIRAGMGDDALTAALLAARCPVLLAPAMNVAMWGNEMVQENLADLRARGRFHVVEPGVGELACGDVGSGRLAEPEEIVAAAEALLAPRPLQGLRALVTSGPTREAIDPVRFLSNRSSGRMGHAMAEALRDAGAEVTLVSGPVAIPPPPGVRHVPVVTAEEMKAASLQALPGVQLVVAAAAVADWRPVTVAPDKLKKHDGAETLQLERTPDVLLALSEAAGEGAARPLFVGFAAETRDLLAYARGKLERKRLDVVVANDVSGSESGFEVEHNAATLVRRAAPDLVLPRTTKALLAKQVVEALLPQLAKR